MEGRESLQSWWQFAAVAQFLSLFTTAFDMDSLTVDQLEDAFLDSSDDYLPVLQTRMLRQVTRNRFVTEESWLMYLKRELDKRNEPFDYNEQLQYSSLPLFTRVCLLLQLCEWQLERPELFKPCLQTEERMASLQWRSTLVGFDSSGSAYWYFPSLNRVYRQQFSRHIKALPATDSQYDKAQWQLVCATEHEWKQWPLQFKDSATKTELKLFQSLQRDIAPRVAKQFQLIQKRLTEQEEKRLKALEEEEQERLKEEAFLLRKRSTRLQMVEVQRMVQRQLDTTVDFEVTEDGRVVHEGRRLRQSVRKTRENSNDDQPTDQEAREKRRLERELKIAAKLEEKMLESIESTQESIQSVSID